MRQLMVGLVTGLAALMLVALGWGLLHPPSADASLVGKVAPDVTIRPLNGGGEVRLSQFRGRPVVLNFWASWCAPCRQEAPTLNAAARRYQGRVQFLGVDIQDSSVAARTFQSSVQSPYPVGPAVAGGALAYGVTAPPETFFIDRQGRVSASVIGPVSERQLQLSIDELSP
ncbi:MAG TPA: TlpA disulfide reductase family protein [Candidatus Dormibacteraeota bacterium]|nr:TlpA disulfide reductase family protein [Candidatus Dormibacteraeota bacterium]